MGNPHGESAEGSEKGFRNDHPGVLGCFLSHILVLRDHLRKCADCDLMVFEDDVAFHPKFRELWQEFTQDLPEDVLVRTGVKPQQAPVAQLHFGGDAFWNAPLLTEQTYYQVSAVSQTWGYVIKARAIQGLLRYLESRNAVVNVAIDTAMVDQAFVERFPTLAPKQPLVKGVGKSSTTAVASMDNVDEGVEKDSEQLWTHSCWIATYTADGVQKCQEVVTEEEEQRGK